VERFRRSRDILVDALNEIPGVRATRPQGAMYVFFRIDGVDESFPFCRGLVQHAGLGLAPGVAFGPEGEGFVRWCFAATEEKLHEGTARFRRALASRSR
jgi:aspartate/methionine/tyrosine aminotransferase